MENKKNLYGGVATSLDSIGQLKIKIWLGLNCQVSKSMIQKRAKR